MKKTGVIKSISRKDGGKTAFTLVGEKAEDGKDQWFNGFTLEAEKGDEIEFELDINGTWHNFKNVKVTKKAEVKSQSQGSNEFRVNVDAGNCVQRAVELVIADKAKTLIEATMQTVAAFKAARKELDEPIEQKPAAEKEVPGAI